MARVLNASHSYHTHEPPGWIVTFIIQIRGGGPSSGYISAGFFGGKMDLTFFVSEYFTEHFKV
jgi:hypothetical protein